MYFSFPPLYVVEFETPELGVSHSRGGDERQQRPIALAHWVGDINRVDHPTDVVP
jgi:hypothetical protein